MSVQIRPIGAEDALDYLRVLPQETGLPIWEPQPAAWHAGAGAWPARSVPSPAQLARTASGLLREGFRPQAAFVDGRLVGASAMLSLEVTVPGPRSVPMGGVTSTGVLPTYRRRGLLRALMGAMLADAQEQGEPLAGLSASEGSIYGRYGFSPATFIVRWELNRHEAQFLETAPAAGELEFIDAEQAQAAWPGLHERVRRTRVGEVMARPEVFEGPVDRVHEQDGPGRFVVHRDVDGEVDGLVHYRLPWSPDPHQAGTVQVEAFEAATPLAYTGLWRLLTDVDLTQRVVAARRPVDEPLRWQLSNPRALRVTRSADNLWLRLVDVGAALRARTYAGTGGLVLDVRDQMLPTNQGRWRLEADPVGASCERAPSATPDLGLDVQALASLYLGGVSPQTLFAAGRIAQLRPGGLATLTRLLSAGRPPYNAVGF